MGSPDQARELLGGADRRLHGRPVPHPVTVVSVGRARALVDTPPDLLEERGHPDRGHAELVEISLVESPADPGEVAS